MAYQRPALTQHEPFRLGPSRLFDEVLIDPAELDEEAAARTDRFAAAFQADTGVKVGESGWWTAYAAELVAKRHYAPTPRQRRILDAADAYRETLAASQAAGDPPASDLVERRGKAIEALVREAGRAGSGSDRGQS
jgi:hypothetical protein